MLPQITDATLSAAAAEGMDAFLAAIHHAIAQSAGGELNADALSALNAEQVTLWGYLILRDEVMDGGFIQLIHNGYGAFFFRNPFAKAVRGWGLQPLAALINRARTLYDHHGEALQQPCSDDEFMALFEQYPDFDALDDHFVEHEEEFTAAIAHYVDEHLDRFVTITA